jgi:heterotetrameric sarcosine oxidase delta subunit
MLLLPCPWCGERPEGEFVCLGEATPPRPADPAHLSDSDWVAYVAFRQNVRGPHRERWWHSRGCGSWFVVERDTVTHAVAAMGEAAS